MIVPNTWTLILLILSEFVLISYVEAWSPTTSEDFSSVLNPNSLNKTNILSDFTFNVEQNKIVKREIVDYSSENIDFHIELGLYGYCKLFLFVVIRIVIGIAIEQSKVKEILYKPIGVVIAVFCNFLLLPVVKINIFKLSHIQ